MRYPCKDKSAVDVSFSGTAMDMGLQLFNTCTGNRHYYGLFSSPTSTIMLCSLTLSWTSIYCIYIVYKGLNKLVYDDSWQTSCTNGSLWTRLVSLLQQSLISVVNLVAFTSNSCSF